MSREKINKNKKVWKTLEFDGIPLAVLGCTIREGSVRRIKKD